MSTALGFAFLLFGAAIPRFSGLDRAVWTAEAWVANSVLADRWEEVFRYDAWLQTTPPLFLVFARVAVKVFGASNLTLRLVPFCLGMLSVALVAVLARAAFAAPFALFCTALVAVSPPAMRYSHELKQYSGDTAATALDLLLLWAYSQRPDRPRYVWVLVAFACTLPLSYTSFMLLPAAVYVLGSVEPAQGRTPRHSRSQRRVRMGRTLGLVLLVLVVGAVEYEVCIRPNLGPQLLEYWKHGFPEWTSLKGVLVFYGRDFLALWANLLPKGARVGLPAAAVFGVVMLVLATLIGAFRKERRPLAVMSLCPVLTLAVLNLLHLYPLDRERLALFLLPCVAIAITLVLEELWKTFLAPNVSAAAGRRWLASIGVLSVAVVLASAAAHDPVPEEDVESALRYLKANVKSGDLLYVHASVIEAVKLYLRMLDWRDAPVLYGQAGFPCCTRAPEDSARRNGRAAAVQEMDRLSKVTTPGSLWLMFTTRDEHWRYLQRDDATLFTTTLRDEGWQSEAVVPFREVIVHRLIGPTSTVAH